MISGGIKGQTNGKSRNLCPVTVLDSPKSYYHENKNVGGGCSALKERSITNAMHELHLDYPFTKPIYKTSFDNQRNLRMG